MITLRSCLLLSFVLLFGVPSVALEATFTPNQEDAAGPLPLSKKQRDQLTKLDDAIRLSSDPHATLNEVAKLNSMNPTDLMNMLERNRSDLSGGRTGGGGALVSSWPQAVLQLITTGLIVLRSMALRHPKTFGLTVSALLLMMYTSWTIPRTGLVLSTHSGLLSRGHTTLCTPPSTYLTNLLESESFIKKSSSFSIHHETDNIDDILNDRDNDDGINWHTNMKPKSTLSQAVTLRLTFHLDDYMPHGKDKDDDDDDDSVADAVSDLICKTASDVVLSHRFTEFSESTRFISSNDGNVAVLVLPKAGDWNGYGLQPLIVTHEEESDTTARVIYSTLTGGLFDGQFSVQIQKTDQGDVVLSLAIAVPKRGRKLSPSIATTLLETLSTSMTTSITTLVQQSQSRHVRSHKFSLGATNRAKERQHLKFVKSIQMEEMATDRRRRRQKTNNNVGRYRPTGQKMPTSTSPGRGQR